MNFLIGKLFILFILVLINIGVLFFIFFVIKEVMEKIVVGVLL